MAASFSGNPPVGVELDLIAEGFDGAQEIGDIWLQQRLTAADADAVEPSLAFFQKSEPTASVSSPGPKGPLMSSLLWQ